MPVNRLLTQWFRSISSINLMLPIWTSAIGSWSSRWYLLFLTSQSGWRQLPDSWTPVCRRIGGLRSLAHQLPHRRSQISDASWWSHNQRSVCLSVMVSVCLSVWQLGRPSQVLRSTDLLLFLVEKLKAQIWVVPLLTFLSCYLLVPLHQHIAYST